MNRHQKRALAAQGQNQGARRRFRYLAPAWPDDLTPGTARAAIVVDHFLAEGVPVWSGMMLYCTAAPVGAIVWPPMGPELPVPELGGSLRFGNGYAVGLLSLERFLAGMAAAPPGAVVIGDMRGGALLQKAADADMLPVLCVDMAPTPDAAQLARVTGPRRRKEEQTSGGCVFGVVPNMPLQPMAAGGAC